MQQCCCGMLAVHALARCLVCLAENKCTCSNGAAATGSACPQDGAEKCMSCSKGYTKVGDSCNKDYKWKKLANKHCGRGKHEGHRFSSEAAAKKKCVEMGTACTGVSANFIKMHAQQAVSLQEQHALCLG